MLILFPESFHRSGAYINLFVHECRCRQGFFGHVYYSPGLLAAYAYHLTKYINPTVGTYWFSSQITLSLLLNIMTKLRYF